MVDIQFPWAFYLAGFIGIAGIAFLFWYRFQRKWREYAGGPFWSLLLPGSSTAKNMMRIFLAMLSICLLIIGIANPRSGLRKEQVKVEGTQVMVCVDVSRSMDAQDVKPSRLEHARQIVHQLLRVLRNHTMGIVVFSARAYLQCPPTLDYSMVGMLTDMINTDMVPIQGTSIASALSMALASFDYESPATRVIVLITDAEDHEGGIEPVLAEVKNRGVFMVCVGVGTPEGATIPIIQNGRVVDFKRDREGNVVTTRFNEALLTNIASATGGVYIYSSYPLTTALAIKDAIEKLQKGQLEETVYTEFYSYYPYFIAAAIVLLIIEFLAGERSFNIMRGILHKLSR